MEKLPNSAAISSPAARPREPGVRRFENAEQQDRRAAAERAALEAEQEEMALELARR